MRETFTKRVQRKQLIADAYDKDGSIVIKYFLDSQYLGEVSIGSKDADGLGFLHDSRKLEQYVWEHTPQKELEEHLQYLRHR